MKIIIEIDTSNAAFEDHGLGNELMFVFTRAKNKIIRQLERPPSLCDAPEADDKVQDSYGNTVGSVRVEVP